MTPQATDWLITAALYLVPVLCAAGAAWLALRRKIAPALLSRWVFIRTLATSVPLALILAALADLGQVYETSAAMALLYFAPPLAMVAGAVAAAAAGRWARRRALPPPATGTRPGAG